METTKAPCSNRGEMTGQSVSHYRVLEKLGAGGMGVVYKAQDLKLDRLVALKFLPLHLSADPQQKRRLIQEAKAACALDHVNIGVVHDIDETSDGQMFIAMAYYDGETLATRIKHGVSTPEAIDIAIQVLKALQAAHERGIVHRDITSLAALVSTTCRRSIRRFHSVSFQNSNAGRFASPEKRRAGESACSRFRPCFRGHRIPVRLQ
jgi:serine/threonine protein kinase